MRDYLGFIIVSANQLVDKLHGWTWTWAPLEHCTAFGLDVIGCWVSTEAYGAGHTTKRCMPPWPGSQGFVPTQVQLARVVAERGISA